MSKPKEDGVETKLKIVTDLLKATKELLGALRAALPLPKNMRSRIRESLDATFLLLDTTLSMVQLRVSDILNKKNSRWLIDEAKQLDNHEPWLNAERQFRLCSNLRAALSEARSIEGKLAGKAFTQDYERLVARMTAMLDHEDELATHISTKFQSLATFARRKDVSGRKVRALLEELRDELKKERKKLIRLQAELYDTI